MFVELSKDEHHHSNHLRIESKLVFDILKLILVSEFS